jgi:hypothetical protein
MALLYMGQLEEEFIVESVGDKGPTLTYPIKLTFTSCPCFGGPVAVIIGDSEYIDTRSSPACGRYASFPKMILISRA